MPKFVAPDLAPPENVAEGDTFEVLAEVKLHKDGVLELVSVDGAQVEYPGGKKKMAPHMGFVEAVDEGMA